MLPLVRGIREGGCIAVAQAPFLGQIAGCIATCYCDVTLQCSEMVISSFPTYCSDGVWVFSQRSSVRGRVLDYSKTRTHHLVARLDITLESVRRDTSSPFVIQWKSSFRCILLWNRHTCPFLCIICHETFEIQ